MFVLGILFGVVNGTSRFLWGHLLDKFGFKILMYTLTFLEIICSCTIYYTVEYDALFIITVLIIAACLGGNFCCISPLYTLIYGIEVGPQMYALAGNVMGIAQFCGPILVKLFLSSKKDYLITFLIGGTFCVCKIAVLLFFDDTEKIEIDWEEKIDKEVNDLNINERLTVEENEKNKN
jgi:MFS family permease